METRNGTPRNDDALTEELARLVDSRAEQRVTEIVRNAVSRWRWTFAMVITAATLGGLIGVNMLYDRLADYSAEYCWCEIKKEPELGKLRERRVAADQSFGRIQEVEISCRVIERDLIRMQEAVTNNLAQSRKIMDLFAGREVKMGDGWSKRHGSTLSFADQNVDHTIQTVKSSLASLIEK